ncbi:MAG: GNAT family N-acetyltransferase [Oscillospiraceae bacterium]|jgi:predicted GNAT family N-acyltransferase|nr:GNAT family N-acetyltransferase [Oscillospiraceae bacterium]
MIRLLRELPPETGIFQSDFTAARVYATMQSYGFRDPHTQFFAQTNARNTVTAVLDIRDGTCVLAATPDADHEELNLFLPMSDTRHVLCAEDAAKILTLDVHTTRCIVRRVDHAKQTAQSENVEIARELSELYTFLCRCFDVMPPRETWLADFALRRRAQTAEAYFLRDNQNNLLGTASVLARTSHIIFLGGVGTIPEARNQGVARRLLQAITSQYPSHDCYLICKTELLPFYAKSGFSLVSHWIESKTDRKD